MNLLADSVLRGLGLPVPVREHRFHSVRRWRFDYAWPDQKIALEVEGVGYRPQQVTRHQRGRGYEKDCEKYNMAAVLGWTVLRYSPQQIKAGSFIDDLKHLMTLRGGVVGNTGGSCPSAAGSTPAPATR